MLCLVASEVSTVDAHAPAAHYAGWGGACTGVGSCIVNITAPTSVSGTFDST